MTDFSAIVWKEWRELIGQPGRKGKQGILLFIAVFGIALPLENGPSWVTSPMVAIAWSWVPMFLVTTVIADAFAGERERHTLETLLASRLPDRAILFGKIGAAVGYAGALTAASLALGLAAVNLANRQQGLLLYPLPTMLAMCVLGFLGAVLVAGIGVLISLRAATVRQAQQTLGGVIMAVLLVPLALVRLMPAAWKHGVAANPANIALLGMALVVALAALDVALIGFATIRFRRARLISE